MSVFTWTPDFSSKKNSEPKVTAVQFGDGYTQRQPQGINSNPKSFDLTFSTRDNSEADAIEAFLDTQGAVYAFDFTPPYATSSLRVVCAKWARSYDSATFSTVTATFMEVFEP